MSDYDDKLAAMPPLGKSVEEVEADSQDRINHPASGDLPEGDIALGAPLPIANTNAGGLGGTFAGGASPVVGLVADPDDPEQGMPEQRAGAARENDDSTDNSEA